MRLASEPHPWPQPVAAEEHQAQEATLEEEGEDAFRRQQRPEDVAHEARVFGPVHAELELHDDAGGDAHGEDDAVDLDPEELQLTPLGVLGPQVHAADEQQHQPQPHGERREDEVVARRQRELQPREKLCVQATRPPLRVRWHAHAPRPLEVRATGILYLPETRRLGPFGHPSRAVRRCGTRPSQRNSVSASSAVAGSGGTA